MFRSIRSFLLAGSIFCAACSTVPKEPALTPAEAFSQIQANQDAAAIPETIRLTAKVDYNDGINKKRVVGRDFIISAKQPASLRVTLSSFDKTLSTLVTNGHTFSLLDAMNNIFVTGIATPQNLSQILPLYLSAHDLYLVLTARMPNENVSEALPDVAWDKKVGAYEKIYNLSDGRIQHVFYSYPDGDMVRVTITKTENDNTQTLYEYEASDFAWFYPAPPEDEDDFDEDELSEDDAASDVPKNTSVKEVQQGPGLRLPKTVIFHLKPEKTDVRLRVEEYAFNVEFAPQVFSLIPPSGTRIVVLDERVNNADNYSNTASEESNTSSNDIDTSVKNDNTPAEDSNIPAEDDNTPAEDNNTPAEKIEE